VKNPRLKWAILAFFPFSLFLAAFNLEHDHL
jgi:hypothetical protein